MTESEMARRNRQVLAERGRWPDGALDACYRIENAFPGWNVWWTRASRTPGFTWDDGFHANRGDNMVRGPRVWAATATELARKLAAHR